jgi:hypothetical protein
VIVDFAMILIPLPFFFLSATVIGLNGRVVDDQYLSTLEQSIRSVSVRSCEYFIRTNLA